MHSRLDCFRVKTTSKIFIAGKKTNLVRDFYWYLHRVFNLDRDSVFMVYNRYVDNLRSNSFALDNLGITLSVKCRFTTGLAHVRPVPSTHPCVSMHEPISKVGYSYRAVCVPGVCNSYVIERSRFTDVPLRFSGVPLGRGVSLFADVD